MTMPVNPFHGNRGKAFSRNQNIHKTEESIRFREEAIASRPSWEEANIKAAYRRMLSEKRRRAGGRVIHPLRITPDE